MIYLQIPDNILEHLKILAQQLRMSEIELTSTLQDLAKISTDSDFLKQVLAINEEITDMSADN